MPIRITGGDFRSRLIASPLTSKTRPTAARTREALFNILQSVSNFKVLDLFAGSGIMGLESLSRGASSVLAVEKNHAQAQMIAKSYRSLGQERALRLLERDAVAFIRSKCPVEGGFDLIYADPPFVKAYPDLRLCLQWLSSQGRAVFECPSRCIPEWAKAAEKRNYGESTLLFF